MKLFDSKTILQWEQFTMKEENLDDESLMHRAATIFANWIDKKLLRDHMPIAIICGAGNNAGDGYAVARILQDRKSPVTCYSLSEKNLSPLCQQMKSAFPGKIIEVKSIQDLHDISSYSIVIDAILGLGASRPFEKQILSYVQYINQHAKHIMSLDIPSGMLPDQITDHETVHAHETLTFSIPHISFFSSTNEGRLGKWIVKSIDLSRQFQKSATQYYIDRIFIANRIKTRSKFGHKGHYGKILFVGGDINYAGAIYLSAHAALRLGAGLVSIASPEVNRQILQTSLPEAVYVPSGNNFEEITVIASNYNVIGIGPGMGVHAQTACALNLLLKNSTIPIVLDADALNNIAKEGSPLEFPTDTIITPHPKEFDRLFGESQNDFERRALQVNMSKKHRIYIILKGAYSSITDPEGNIYYNSTGNPGMATGGSGDILVGMICALLGQQYDHLESCLLATYLHGLAGDMAAKERGEMNMISSDIITYFSQAIKMIK